MPMPKELYHRDVLENMEQSWRTQLDNMTRSLDLIEQNLNEVAEMSDACTSEWCTATEHVLDDMANAIFTISEPRWAPKEDSQHIKQLKRRMHDLYTKFQSLQS
ncbi:MAG: hypothetical protein R6U50_10470 [Desulfobacterales bacterium]